MKRMVMRRTATGSPNGFQVHTYQKGQVYILPDDLADAFASNGAAEPVVENKQVDPATESHGTPVASRSRRSRRQTRPASEDAEVESGEVSSEDENADNS